MDEDRGSDAQDQAARAAECRLVVPDAASGIQSLPHPEPGPGLTPAAVAGRRNGPRAQYPACNHSFRNSSCLFPLVLQQAPSTTILVSDQSRKFLFCGLSQKPHGMFAQL